MPDIAAAPNEGAEFSFVLKVETDSLDPTVILVLVLYDLRTKQMFTFDDRPGSQAPISMGAEIASLADTLIVHSPYAVKALTKLCGVAFDPSKMIDTLKGAQTLTGPGGKASPTSRRASAFSGASSAATRKWSELAQPRCQEDARLIVKIFECFNGIAEVRV
jgi:hypothetical protein